MAMKLIETTVSGSALRMRYADDADATKASEWVDFQVRLSHMEREPGKTIADPELLFLAELRRAALEHVQSAIGAEIRRLQALANRTP